MDSSTGSPTKKLPTSFSIFEDKENAGVKQTSLKRATSAMPLPLASSTLVNKLPVPVGVSPKDNATKPASATSTTSVDDLLAKLTEHQAVLSRQKQELEDTSSTGTDPYATTPPTESIHSIDGRPDAAEVFRLKKELEFAKERMVQMDRELSRERSERIAQAEMEFSARQTVEAAIGSPLPQQLAIGGTFRGRASPMSALQSHSGYTPPITPMHFPEHHFGLPTPVGAPCRQQPPIGTRSEFSAGTWNMPLPPSATYMSTTEPLNYRRLLDRHMSCNWKYIVDKIVCNNDQQASIFLQQKLKVGTTDQKFDIVQAIIDQAYPLMVNRFGNFLVQRCFEHGTPEQIVAIAQAIRGNTLNLSMDAFGCHVVQKAFDCVPEEYKAIMVHELLRRIPETVIHRYACHVWQKLFELRWSDSPPQIMKYVNEALRGMWHEVALGETGSLVVQNIFENCLEEDKRPCIAEVLASLDVVAHGQFGNWCIQHICEHGSIPDRTRAIDHVLRFATEYSMDQFASKVVEKCLKVGGTDFLDRYLDRVCEARQDRPRMPLVDISGDQFGNYLIQYILTSADSQRRDIVATHIRKHMVSLRGSKYGSRVAMLCCNPAFATRPGPAGSLPPSRNNNYRYNDYLGGDQARSYSGDRQFNGGMGRSGFNGGYR